MRALGPPGLLLLIPTASIRGRQCPGSDAGREGGRGSDIPKPVPTSVAAGRSTQSTELTLLGVLEAKRRRESLVSRNSVREPRLWLEHTL